MNERIISSLKEPFTCLRQSSAKAAEDGEFLVGRLGNTNQGVGGGYSQACH